MKTKKILLSSEMLHDLFEYNDDSGDLISKKSKKSVGSHRKRVPSVKVSGKEYQKTHIICIMKLGFLPKNITSTDGNPSNTSWSNIAFLEEKIELSQKHIKELFNYSSSSGLFTRKITRRSFKKGDIAGRVNSAGYVTIGVAGKNRAAHRLAWLYTYGYLPKMIDHINHNKTDNRIANLRDVTASENAKNLSLNDANTSGQTGVTWNKAARKWKSYIKVDRQVLNLGTFTEFHKAVDARKNAEVLYGFHENHGH